MPSYVNEPGGKKAPPRVAARPNPRQWDLDELMTLPEAAALIWPNGPLTARSLRTAVDDGMLPVVMVARKLMTCRRAIVEMGKCTVRTKPDTAPRKEPPPAADKASRAVRPASRTGDATAAYDRLMRNLADRGV